MKDGYLVKIVLLYLTFQKNLNFVISGPALPQALFGNVVVTNPEGDGVLVVGGNGSAGPGGHRDTLYELICTSDGQCQWVELPQKLQVARSDHIAMLVPDDAVACKK